MWLDAIARPLQEGAGFGLADWAALGAMLVLLVAAIVVPNAIARRTSVTSAWPSKQTSRQGHSGKAA